MNSYYRSVSTPGCGRCRFFRLFIGVALVLGLAAPAAQAQTLAPAAPTGLLLERLDEPLGIEHPSPAMSWIMVHPGTNQVQTAYQVQVGHSAEALANDEAAVWDSGKVASADSSNARYGGPPLLPNTGYAWRVRVWDREDRVSPYSVPQPFVTAMHESWEATPIWAPDTPAFAFLRRAFALDDRAIAQATAKVTALSPEPASQYVYRIWINGAFVGLGPERGFGGATRYNTFDVTDTLRSGVENAIAALVYTTDDHRFLFQLDIDYADGTRDTVVSDDSWKARDATAVYVDGGNAGHDSYYYAPREFIDMRAYPMGWKRAGFDDSTWKQAVVRDAIDGLRPSATAAEREVPVAPALVVEHAPGHYFVDFGRSLIGGFRLRDIAGAAGQAVEVRLGQEAPEPPTVRYAKRTGNTYQEVWTLREGVQSIAHFGYRSYRYAEVIGAPAGLDASHFEAVALRQPFHPEASPFASSDAVLNDVWELLQHGLAVTSLGVYVDTHSRERRNYEGDAYIHQLSQYAVERQYAFPRYSMEYLFHRPTWPTEYKQVVVMMAWNDYLYTGNADSLRAHYGLLRENTLEPFINADDLVEKPENVGGRFGRDLIDWPHALRDGYQFSEINTVINAFNYRAIAVLAKIAKVLGEEEDAAAYTALAERLRAAINMHLLDDERGAYRDGKGIDHHALHASAMSVALGLAPPEALPALAEHIFGRGMQCNLYGAQFVLEALYTAGRGDLALQRMNAADGNSWGHMIYNLGATIATEAWDPSQKGNMAFSHSGWGSPPTNNIARGLFGIVPLEPAFARFQVKPQPGGLAWARYTQPTIRGPVGVSFETEGAAFTMTVSVPANTEAVVYVPVAGVEAAGVARNGEDVAGTRDGDHIRVDGIGSGTHTFTLVP